jgi:hypothetical protein
VGGLRVKVELIVGISRVVDVGSECGIFCGGNVGVVEVPWIAEDAAEGFRAGVWGAYPDGLVLVAPEDREVGTMGGCCADIGIMGAIVR